MTASGSTEDCSAGLQVDGLRHNRGSFSLSVQQWAVSAGTLVGLVGVNGAGKTTFMRILAGDFQPSSGKLSIMNTPIGEFGWRLPELVGFVPDSLAGIEDLTLVQHFSFLSAVYPGWDAEYADTLARRLSVPLDKRLRILSRGTRAKAGFILVEAARPLVLLLDEPTSGLDPVVRQELLAILDEIRRDRPQRIVVFSTHILEDVLQAASSISLVRRGEVLPCIPRSALDEQRSSGPQGGPELMARLFNVESFA